MTNQRKEFGKKLIEIREIKGLRQADVAEIANLSQRSIGRLERGEIGSASVDSLIELSKVYNLDILSLYKKYIYGNYYLLEEIKKSLDINAIFLSEEIKRDLLEKINLIKDKRDLQAKRYEIDLLELFINYLNDEASDDDLKNNFEDLSSSKIKRGNFSNIDLSSIELRILLNIATSSKSFKNIDSLEILEKCKNQDKDSIIKIAACNNLANFYKYYGNFNKTMETINEGLRLSCKLSSIDGLIYLNFVKFITLYRTNGNYEKSLQSTIVFSQYSNNSKLSMAINKKINKIIHNSKAK
ncbi:helix-turn-helix domain-containing protein [Anaerococcus sp. NML200574]|uniref:helix-turn-helix domain-containing protein n=1 Tax=Anaerococcus sp. NML200574 TaxID=2954486 RepID=UPI0022375A71|nr:helix-turn-helix transcriptional regulator [Anaerococcus sp. NML200574]MCW6679427.1 helix-turn-helix domain-containing protein [Anaerococcus sp. NML200574]